MLRKKVEESLKSAAIQADAMLQRQEDMFSVLHTLDACIQYGSDNEEHLTAEARRYKTQLHKIRSICMYDLVRYLHVCNLLQGWRHAVKHRPSCNKRL